MAVSGNGSYSSVVFQKVLRLLGGLNASNTGTTIYKHIQRTLHDLDEQNREHQQCLHELLDMLVSTLVSQLDEDSPYLVDAHILQMSLVPGMSISDLATLKQQLQSMLSEICNEKRPATKITRHAFQPLIDEFGASTAMTAAPAEAAIEEHEQETFIPADAVTGSQKKEASVPSSRSEARATHNVDLAYRHHLDKTRDNIQTIQNNLSEQVSNAINFNSELTNMLQTSIDAMRQADTPEDIKAAKDAYIRQCNELIRSQQDLVTKFDSIHAGLHDIESNSQNLDNELTRVHLLSMTDELTELPNRRALMQRMDDEVARVQRYGYPLALAIIDLDEFKPINDRFGHAAGDAVLKHFSQNVFSVFRHHDTVARYGGEEFAVLLPNTDLEGALCALKKVQRQLDATTCYLDSGVEISTPTFSAGIAIYNPGETPDELIKRADMAMYRAKRMGRNRIEVHTMGTKHSQQASTTTAS